MIKILMVEDSETEAALLKSIFSSEKDFEIIACAKNGKEAVELNNLLKPDLITMDIHMPIMNGFEATRSIMSQHPVPIVVISSKLNDESLNATFNALEAGAISVLEKPVNVTLPSFNQEKRKIIDTLRSMAEIKVIKRRFHAKDHYHPKPQEKQLTDSWPQKFDGQLEIIAIGASVGGPQALKKILEKLDSHFPIPIVIVQHMTKGFISSFTKWLNTNTELHVVNPQNNEVLKKGYVYFAPDDYHFLIAKRDSHLIAKLVKGKPISGFYPSVTALFQSVAKTCGNHAIGILLTGMGNDGARGLLELKQAKGHTIIQDRESAIVFGMAGVAQSLGAVDKVIELEQIADYLLKLVAKNNKSI